MSEDSGKIMFDDTYQLFGIGFLEAQKIIQTISSKSVNCILKDLSGIVEIQIKSVHHLAFHRMQNHLIELFSDYLLVGPNKTITRKLVEKLINNHQVISTAESMTGGMIATFITEIENSSKILKECYILYSDEAKTKVLGVKNETIARFGVTSEEVALEMVENLQKLTGSDICVSVTGVAGPSSDAQNTPVGTVYIGFIIKGISKVLECHFEGSRELIRRQATNTAIAHIYKTLIS